MNNNGVRPCLPKLQSLFLCPWPNGSSRGRPEKTSNFPGFDGSLNSSAVSPKDLRVNNTLLPPLFASLSACDESCLEDRITLTEHPRRNKNSFHPNGTATPISSRSRLLCALEWREYSIERGSSCNVEIVFYGFFSSYDKSNQNQKRYVLLFEMLDSKVYSLQFRWAGMSIHCPSAIGIKFSERLSTGFD